MPIIQVNMLEGRTVQQKRDMVAAITDAVVRSLGSPRESVRILINELQEEHFAVAGVTAGQGALSARSRATHANAVSNANGSTAPAHAANGAEMVL